MRGAYFFGELVVVVARKRRAGVDAGCAVGWLVLVLDVERGSSGRTRELVDDCLANGRGCADYDADEAVLVRERCQPSV